MSGSELQTDRLRPELRLPGVAECLRLLLAAAQQRESSPRQLADAVERDPALLYDFLRVAQPANLATWYEELDPELVRVIAINRGMDLLRMDLPGSDEKRIYRLWKQSLATAALNEAITAHLFADNEILMQLRREAYLCGLMVHVAELADTLESPVTRVVSESADPLTGASTGGDANPDPAESANNKATASADMLENLLDNPLLIDAVRFRNKPVESLADSHWLVRVMAVSSGLVESLLEQEAVRQDQYQLSHQLLNLASTQVDQCIIAAKQRLADIIAEVDDPVVGGTDDQRYPRVDHSSSLRVAIVDSSALAVITNLLEQSDHMEGWWDNVQVICRHIFGFGGCFLFRPDKVRQQLRSVEVSSHEFIISLERPVSTLAQAANDQCVTSSGDINDLAVVDQQLVRLANAQSLVCVPISNEGDLAAVIAFGVIAEHTDPKLPISELVQRFSELVVDQYERRMIATLMLKDSSKAIDPEYFQIRAREVTHEINNPLSVVQNYMKILSLKLGDDSSVQGDLKTIGEEINRISGIVKKFSQIASESEIGASVLNLNEVVKDIVGVFRGSAPATRFVLQLDENIPSMDISRDSIKQVLVNLLKNAVEAMEDQGNIVVKTTAQVNFGGNPHVEILVSDDGPGIPIEIQQRLFKQVKTSKGPAHGGLGLTIVKKLIDEMNGFISCRSGEDTGTDFQILLPVSSGDKN